MRMRGAWAGLVLLVASCSPSVSGVPVGATGDAGEGAGAPASTRESAGAPGAEAEGWQPSASEPDPSTRIEGIYIGTTEQADGNGPISYPDYQAAVHISPDQRVSYDRYPPVGGPHDSIWATCDGVEYAAPVRNENMVHALEHGAIWIAYNPETIAAGDREKLASRLTDYVLMSPYPGLKTPISLQFWAHQLPVDSADDPRVEQFFTALYHNQWVYPETGARCDEVSDLFDSANPPPFVAEPPGDDAVQMDGTSPEDSPRTFGELPGTAGFPPGLVPDPEPSAPTSAESVPPTTG